MAGQPHSSNLDWTDLPELPAPDRLRPQPPAEGEVHLWLIHLQVPRENLAVCANLLSSDEAIRANSFRFHHLRDRYTVTRGAVRQILASCLETSPAALRFSYSPQGKPTLNDDANPHHLTFNISHSQDLAILALAKLQRVGIDLERRETRRDLEQIATRNFSRNEAAAIASLPPNQRADAFYACWTLKEAYLKAIGDGLSTPLDSFEVHFPPIASASLASIASSPGEHLRWQAHSFTLERHTAALIVEGRRHASYRAVWNFDSKNDSDS